MLNDSKWFRQSQLFNTRSEHSCVTGPRPSTTRPHHTGAKGVALATHWISNQVHSVPAEAHGAHRPVCIVPHQHRNTDICYTATPTPVSDRAAQNGSFSFMSVPSSVSVVSPLSDLEYGTLCPSPSTNISDTAHFKMALKTRYVNLVFSSTWLLLNIWTS